MIEPEKNIPNWILGYGCVSLAGRCVEAYFDGLLAGLSHSRRETASASTAFEAIVTDLVTAWHEAEGQMTDKIRDRIQKSGRLGVIFASTKGFIDDFIFQPDSKSLETDPLSPILRKFLELTRLKAVEKTAVSNACVSSLSALQLARIWIQSGRASDVLIIAADRKGAFVTKGFQTLGVISPDRSRPFSADRSGFFLGTAAAAVLISSEQCESDLKIINVMTDSAPGIMTNAVESTKSLKRACLKLGAAAPDLVIAHGTATPLNDAIEDEVFHQLAVDYWQQSPPVTSTKWSIGHTLAVSGAMDLIAACEVLRQQKSFGIASTDTPDSAFKSNFLTLENYKTLKPLRIDRVLVSSLGFGGVHGALQIERDS